MNKQQHKTASYRLSAISYRIECSSFRAQARNLLMVFFIFIVSLESYAQKSSVRADTIYATNLANPATNKGIIISDTLKLLNFTNTSSSGLSTDSLLTINTTNGYVRKVALSRLKDSLKNISGWLVGGNPTGEADTVFGSTNSTPLTFRTNNAERMRILSGGNVGIGTSTPAFPLVVNGGVNDIVKFSSSAHAGFIIESSHVSNGHPYISFKKTQYSGSFPSDPLANLFVANPDNIPLAQIDMNRTEPQTGKNTRGTNICFWTTRNGEGNMTERLFIDQNGDVIPAGDNLYLLGRSGARWTAVWAANGTIQTSDIRLKKNITSLRYGLKEVLQIDPISYSWKSDNINKIKLGVSAQQVQTVLPEVVSIGDDKQKTLGINYSDIIPVLINAIKEQQVIIDELKRKVESIK